MSDVSLFDASQATQVPTSSIDASQIDKNLRTISAVTSAWSLPELPDETKLDLASLPGVDHHSLNALLTGIDSDLNTPPAVQPPAPQLVVPSLQDQLQPSALDTTRRIVSGIANEHPPTEVTGDAVKRFKLSAIEKGYMDAPPDGQVDSAWSPELTTIQRQMSWDQTNAAYRGDRPGSIPFSKALNLLDKWTSPSGLLTAATKLDLWWDPGAIGHEFSTWGDKWRKVGKSKNPLDFGKNLVDALTGPIDDVVLPAVNWALLVTGVSEAYDFAKVAQLGYDTVKGAEAVDGLYDVGKVISQAGRFGYDAVADVKNFGEASGLANRLGSSSIDAVKTAGDAMSKWRELTPVMDAKKFIQTGMKLGVVSQAEDLLPGSHGSMLPGQAQIHDDVANFGRKNPLISGARNLSDLILTPYSTFGGQLSSGARAVGAKAVEALGTAPGRAVAGAVVGAAAGTLAGNDTGDTIKGALAGAGLAAALPVLGKGMSASTEGSVLSKLVPKSVGHVGDFLQHLTWTKVDANQRLAVSMHNGILASLADKPEELARYTDGFNKDGGVLGGLSALHGVDRESAGATLAYGMLSASIDHTAAATANGNKELYFKIRSKLMAQVSSFDLENPGQHTLTDIAVAAAKGTPKPQREFGRLLETFQNDPNLAFQYAQKHNLMAQDTIKQLTSVENLPDLDPEMAASLYGWPSLPNDERLAVFQKYMPQVMDTFGNWPKYTAHTQGLHDVMGDGLLDDAVFNTWKDAKGVEKPIPRSQAPAAPVAVGAPSVPEQISQGVNDNLFRSVETDQAKVLADAKLDVLARAGDPLAGRMTLMLKDSPTEQYWRGIHSELKDLQQAHLDVSRLGGTLPAVAKAGGTDSMTASMFASALGVTKEKDLKAARRVFDFAKRRGLSFEDAQSSIKTMIDDAVNDPRITDSLGYGVRGVPNAGEKLGPLLNGPEALAQRVKDVAKKAQYTAADIDHDKLLRSAAENFGTDSQEYQRLDSYLTSLDDAGYKLAHGVDFMMPEDLAFHTPIFSDITTRHLNAVTLGNFFGGRMPEEFRLAQDNHARMMVADELDKIGSNLDTSIHGPDVNNIMADLRSVLQDQKMVSRNVLDDASNSSWLQKRIAAVKTSTTPIQLTDLRTKPDKVIAYLSERYGEDNARAAYKALARMRQSDFKDVGLAAIEAKLRTNNQLSHGLKILSGTDHGSDLLSRTTLGRTAGAIAGGVYATQTNKDGNDYLAGLEGAGIGAAVGTGAQAIASPFAERAAKAFDNSKWFKYGYLADNLARFRDTMRFTLSPFFDISRFTEGTMLNQIGAPLRDANGARVVMPLNASPSKIIKGWTKEAGGGEAGRAIAEQKFKDLARDFEAASRGQESVEATDTMQRWFAQVGIMGFNPLNWQIAAFHHLKQAGFNSTDAFEHAKAMYTYGTHGRSAAEQSVNTIFFPFSFQKKTYTHLIKYMADDQSRAIMLHDAAKAYEMLSQKYDLPTLWRDHLPAIELLQRLNLFAYGLSPGKLGGINRPFVEPIVNMAINAHGQNEAAPGILNLFSPHGLSIKSMADAAQVQNVMKSLMPVMNDINQMTHDLGEEGHVLMSPTHQTNAAEARDGWDEWNRYKQDLGTQLTSSGLTFSDMSRKPWLANVNAAYKTKQAELGAKYPGWIASRTKSLQNMEALNVEKSNRINKANAGIGSEADNMMAEFEARLQPIKDQMKALGITDTADLPPDIFQEVQNLAVQYAKQNLEFRRIYKKFYQPDYGPIEAAIQ